MVTKPPAPVDADLDSRSRGDPSAEADLAANRLFRRILIWSLPLAAIFYVLVPTSLSPVFRLFSIPSGSMAPALRVGSLALVSRASYGYSRHSFDWFELPIKGRWPGVVPARGDIVVFRLPSKESQIWIKRVIGLPGDTVEMRQGVLWLNGKAVPRPKAADVADPFDGKHRVAAYVEKLPDGPSYTVVEVQGSEGQYDNTAPVTVPPGHLFMMGDNRDNSNDSRNPNSDGMGLVPEDHVIGRVVFSFGGR